ncbi:MAG: hypothetical protein ACR2IT_10260 [Pirellulales bacterium]
MNDSLHAAIAGLMKAGFPVMVLHDGIGDPVAESADDGLLDRVSVLVPPDCQAAAGEGLMQAGWSLPPEVAREQTLGGVAARHVWPLVRGRAGIKLHHFATVFNRLRKDDDRLWRYSAPGLWRGIPVRIPRREHALLLAIVEGVCGAVPHREVWLERARHVLDGPSLEWPEFLHDVRLRALEAIMHAGLARLAREMAAPVPQEALDRLEIESSPAQRAELARRLAPPVAASDDDVRQDYAIALVRYRRRHEFTDPTQAAQAPSATLSLELSPDGATAWITIPDDKVPTDWLVLRVAADLPAAAFDGRTAIWLSFPGLPVGAVPVTRPGAGPPNRFAAMLPFHQGFLAARGIDKLGLAMLRDGRPPVSSQANAEQPVSVRVDCLMAITGKDSAVGHEPARPRPAEAVAGLPVPAPPAAVHERGGPRLVLCRPRGGLNDTLNQIERCWAYAERFGRRLFVDASRSGLSGPFTEYFRLRDATANVALHPSPEDEAAFDTLPAEPAELTGRIGTYVATYGLPPLGHRADGPGRAAVRFDPDRPHAAALLVHEQGGGGTDSLAALRRLRFTDPVAEIIRSRVAPLGTGYLGVHLRHTDDRVDAEGVFASLRAMVAGRRVIVCTDDPAVIELARGILNASEVLTASTIQDANGRPQHDLRWFDAFPDPASRRRANLDALVDLVALGRADRVFVTRCYSGRHSGFGRLAQLLSEHRDVLDGLFESVESWASG